MRPLDSLLLGSFPAPPTHIPLTPTSPNPPPSRPPSSPLPPLPTRTPSPDIPTIISATPRVKQRTSQALYRPASDDDDTRSWIDHDDSLHFADLERQLEGFDSDDSDSSLDLHTPLPHLMMRHGLLSPQSRLITQPHARDSVVSLASTTTSHPLKDSRDTTKRRVRHRDGRLLRGGIGLTTGLGWSDSEDEGAPSALTRRISSLNLTSRPSVSSLAASRSTASLSSVPSRSSSSGASDLRASISSRKSSSASFARSYSSLTSLRMSDFNQVDEFGSITTPKPRTPTTLSIRSHRSARVIPEGEVFDPTDEHMGPTIWTSSPDMEMSLAELEGGGALLNREKSLPPLPRSMRAMRASSTGTTEGRARSISTASSASRGSTGSTQGGPSPSVRATITRVSTASASQNNTPYAYNSAKSTPDTSASMIKTPRLLRLTTPTTSMPPPSHTPAPLLLAQRQKQRTDRPAVPVPVPVPVSAPVISVDTHALLESRCSLPSSPSTPSPVTPGGTSDRPRPRVGTGMTYRSSVSRIRVPSGIVTSTSSMHKPIPL